MKREQDRAALNALLEMVQAPSAHPLGVVVLTEPSGARCMELRRWVETRPLVVRAPYSPLVLAACLAEDCPIEYRAVVRLPKGDR